MTCGCTVVVLYCTVLLHCTVGMYCPLGGGTTTSCSHPGRRNNLICADTRCAGLRWAALRCAGQGAEPAEVQMKGVITITTHY